MGRDERAALARHVGQQIKDRIGVTRARSRWSSPAASSAASARPGASSTTVRTDPPAVGADGGSQPGMLPFVQSPLDQVQAACSPASESIFWSILRASARPSAPPIR